jgi:hypothetical protein
MNIQRCQILCAEVARDVSGYSEKNEMTFQKLFVVGLVAGSSLLVIKFPSRQAGDQPLDLTSLSEADLTTMTIQLERTQCFGTCPAYSVTIHGDGRVEYNGKSHVKETGAREGRIETDKLRSLASEFAKTKFSEIVEDYSEKCRGRVCTDFPTAITEFSIKGISHRVKHYYGCASAPKSLFQLESAIDQSTNSQKWTGDVSKAGPFGTTCFAN